MCNKILSVFKDGDTTTFCRCSTTLRVKRCLSRISCILICVHYILFYPWLPLRRVCVHLINISYLCTLIRSSLSLSILRLNNPSYLNTSLYIRCSTSLIILGPLLSGSLGLLLYIHQPCSGEPRSEWIMKSGSPRQHLSFKALCRYWLNSITDNTSIASFISLF